MARKLTLKKPDSKIYKGWTFVLILSAVLAVLALFHRAGANAADYATAGDGSTGCQVKVRFDSTLVLADPRADAEVLTDLGISTPVLDANPGLTGSYRQLESGGWVDNSRLEIVPGSSC